MGANMFERKNDGSGSPASAQNDGMTAVQRVVVESKRA
jgi:hypothetical protein